MTELERGLVAAHAALEEWSEAHWAAIRDSDTPHEWWAESAARGRQLLEHADALAARERAELLRRQGGPAPAPQRGRLRSV